MYWLSAYKYSEEARLTPFSSMAILSARRAVDSRCVIKMTVFVRSPVGDVEICSTVSKILLCACASSEDVYKVPRN